MDILSNGIDPNVITRERLILIIGGSINIFLDMISLLFQLCHRKMIRKAGIFIFIITFLLSIEGIYLLLSGTTGSLGQAGEGISTKCKVFGGVEIGIYVASTLYINFYATFLNSIIKSVYLKAKKKMKIYHVLVVFITSIYVLGLYMLPYILRLFEGGELSDYNTIGHDMVGLCRIENSKNIYSYVFIVYITLPFWVTLIWGAYNMIRLHAYVPTMHKKTLQKPLRMYMVFYLSFIILDSINPLINLYVEIACFNKEQCEWNYEKSTSNVMRYLIVAIACCTGIAVALNVILQKYVLCIIFPCLKEEKIFRIDKEIACIADVHQSLLNRNTESEPDIDKAVTEIAKNQSYFTIHNILHSICYVIETLYSKDVDQNMDLDFESFTQKKKLVLTKKNTSQSCYLTKTYKDKEMRSKIKITAYNPDIFKMLIETNDKISYQDMINSFSPIHNENSMNSFEYGAGKSQSFFFKTSDQKYIVKTAYPNELTTLQNAYIPQTTQYLRRHGQDTPLVRFYLAATINVKYYYY